MGDLVPGWTGQAMKRRNARIVREDAAAADLERSRRRVKARAAADKLEAAAEIISTAMSYTDGLTSQAMHGTMTLVQQAVALTERAGVVPSQLMAIIDENAQIKSRMLQRFGGEAMYIISKVNDD